jgi:outer membrane murein-binding lipoprotein Lpp
MTEESTLNKLKEENEAIRARMEAAEEKANKVNELIKKNTNIIACLIWRQTSRKFKKI